MKGTEHFDGQVGRQIGNRIGGVRPAGKLSDLINERLGIRSRPGAIRIMPASPSAKFRVKPGSYSQRVFNAVSVRARHEVLVRHEPRPGCVVSTLAAWQTSPRSATV